MITKIENIFNVSLYLLSKDTKYDEVIASIPQIRLNKDWFEEKTGTYGGYVMPICTQKSIKCGYIIQIFNYNINTIVHECVHVLDFIIQDCSLTTTFDSTEYRAYFMGWLSDKISSYLGLSLQDKILSNKQ